MSTWRAIVHIIINSLSIGKCIDGSTDFCITQKKMNQSECFTFILEIEIEDFDWFIPLCVMCYAESYASLLTLKHLQRSVISYR